MRPGFQLRISTIFLLLALIELPVSALWVPVPFMDDGARSRIFGWTLYHFIPDFFGVAFVIATLSGIVFAFRRKWRPVLQCGIEMATCFAAAIVLPVY